MDEGFFGKIVAQICSTMDLQKAIMGLQKLLSAKTEIEGVFIGHYASDKKYVHNLGYAGKDYSEELHYRQAAHGVLDEYLLSNKRQELNIIDRLGDFPALAETLPAHIPLDHSLYECRVRLDDEHIGMLAFHAKTPNLSNDIRELLLAIRAPIALNLANKLLQLQLLQQGGQVDLSTDLSDPRHIICTSLAMRSVYGMLSAAAPTNNTILLNGETGVGKDVLARHIHAISLRNKAPFIHVNCGSIPSSLIESELFGHERGSFTGANASRIGFFEQADGGTIFLDEIGELPLIMQTKLLQVLQNKTIRKVGGSKEIPIDFRVITATNRDLEMMCHEGEFRRDLFFRLHCIQVEIPPLRARREDIPLLVERLLIKIVHDSGELNVPVLSNIDMDRLVDYDWPGNIRELENCLQRSWVLSAGRNFCVHLPVRLKQDIMPLSAGIPNFERQGINDIYHNNIPSSPHITNDLSLNTNIKNHLEEVLRLANGRIHGNGGAAELLKINPSTLRSKLKKMGISFGKKR